MIQDSRTNAVVEAVERIRAVAKGEMTRETLDAIQPIVTELASRRDLFPPGQFPLGPNGTGRVYYLAQDPDGRFAMYASAGALGKKQPPHNHTTWAVISGVYGDEHNVLYERTGERLAKVREVTVRKGNAVALMPNDFHTIEVTAGEQSLHVHAYGRSLEQLPERIYFETPAGGSFKTFPANPNITSPRIDASDVKAAMGSKDEIALLDVRDEREYAKGHPLYAASLPSEHVANRIRKLVPRETACIVLYDEGCDRVEAAAATLRGLGYKNVSIMAGGIAAWRDAGFELFGGFNVPSKAFGEFVEHARGTPHIDAAELKAKLDAGEDVVVLDSRPPEEFANMSIPGALDCPGAELVYRTAEVAPDPSTLVVVNCAGRTRSIIGAQSLIDAEFPNRVVALRNGTMGWQLAGFAIERGASRSAAPPGAESQSFARRAAQAVAERFGVRTIDLDELARLRTERGRTLYVFDVRTREEYEASHLTGARWAPGGQLVQATDAYVAVRNARLVLVDSDGVRARMTAAWLVQMGAGEIFVLDDPRLDSAPHESGAEPGYLPDFGDVRNKPYGSPEVMKAYLSWETSLIEQIRRDGDAPFLEL
jgi:rhodanese-related sulfurtransferase/predicted metal-dependent enzyme (double-stranded beta helix superfamily)